MPEINETSLEVVLREHLTAELNGQLGRPAAAFFAHVVVAERMHVAGASGELPAPLRAADPRPRGTNRFNHLNGWFLGLAGAAMAASIAALWAAPGMFKGHAAGVPVQSVQPGPTVPHDEIARAGATPDGSASTDLAALSSQPKIQWIQRRTLDGGTVVLDDPAVPAHKIRQQELEHSQWYDPARRARVEMTVPREHIKFVEMDTY